MAILVYAEHDNKELKKATLNTVTAASKIGGDIVVLVAGLGCEAVAEQAAKVAVYQRCFAQVTLFWTSTGWKRC